MEKKNNSLNNSSDCPRKDLNRAKKGKPQERN